MNIKAKFFVMAVKRHANQHNPEQFVTVELQPVYGDTEENKKFWHATPSGKIEMTIKSDAAEFFEVGTFVYVDFTPAE